VSAAGFLAGRGAVVTGGGRGIGAAIAEALANAGAGVVVAARTASEIEAVAARLRARGAAAHAVKCDVADEEAVAGLADVARTALGHVDVLVCAAGEGAAAPFARIALADWKRMLDVHATGTFLCARGFVPDMVTRGWGRVVNVASTAGLEGAKYIAHYAAAKHAMVGFTRSLALELEGSGVTANALCPGYVDSPMTEKTLANVSARTGLSRSDALVAVLAAAQQERLITVAEVADAGLALCRDDAHGINGEAIVLHPKAVAR
jgi:NAD(P)-dependent dehydrogenase (short-subunit alcohol dehydrogenase family)